MTVVINCVNLGWGSQVDDVLMADWLSAKIVTGSKDSYSSTISRAIFSPQSSPE